MASKAREWEEEELRNVEHLAMRRGLVSQSFERGPEVRDFVHLPLTLRPSAFPRRAYDEAVLLADDYNVLARRMEGDLPWLRQVLGPVAAQDEFVARLLSIACPDRVRAMGALRSDYMLDVDPERPELPARLLQVELNCISAGLAGMSSVMARMHAEQWPEFGAQLPDDHGLDRFADAFGVAAAEYGCSDVLFVVRAEERNIGDHKAIEYALWQRHRLRVTRATLAEIHAHATLEGPDRRLCMNGREFSVVYFRAGYDPVDYPDDEAWQARSLVDRAHCYVVPSVALQLAGTKMVQCQYSHPERLAELLPGPEHESRRKRLQASFAPQYVLNDEEGSAEARREAEAHPERYVLKPQREGGGNNLFGEDLREFLRHGPAEQRGLYILMRLIRAPVFAADYLIRGRRVLEPSVSELGTFSCYVVGPHQGVLHSQFSNHLLRTKPASANEGSIMRGSCAIDTPLFN